MNEEEHKDSFTFSGIYDNSFINTMTIHIHLETRVPFYIQFTDRVWGVPASWASCNNFAVSVTGWELLTNSKSRVPDTFQVALLSDS